MQRRESSAVPVTSAAPVTAVLLMLILGGLAGCLGDSVQPTESSCTDPCGPGVFATGATVDGVILVACDEVRVAAMVPAERARAALPGDRAPWYDDLNVHHVAWLRCAESYRGSEALGAVEIVYDHMRVNVDGRSAVHVFGIHVDAEAVRDALVSEGFPAALAVFSGGPDDRRLEATGFSLERVLDRSVRSPVAEERVPETLDVLAHDGERALAIDRYREGDALAADATVPWRIEGTHPTARMHDGLIVGLTLVVDPTTVTFRASSAPSATMPGDDAPDTASGFLFTTSSLPNDPM